MRYFSLLVKMKMPFSCTRFLTGSERVFVGNIGEFRSGSLFGIEEKKNILVTGFERKRWEKKRTNRFETIDPDARRRHLKRNLVRIRYRNESRASPT